MSPVWVAIQGGISKAEEPSYGAGVGESGRALGAKRSSVEKISRAGKSEFCGTSAAVMVAAMLAASVLVALLWPALQAHADTTFTVTSAADTAGNTCGSGCTLR